MSHELKKIQKSVFTPLDLQISNIIPDPECEEYFGFNFKINQTEIKFRKSKLTPKKIGQFVTFWKRNPDGKTIPFDINDGFDFYIISIQKDQNSGFFIFPKATLEREDLISSQSKTGKRGFRIYSDWHFPNSKQAEKTKLWQTQYFINYSNSEKEILGKFQTIFNDRSQ